MLGDCPAKFWRGPATVPHGPVKFRRWSGNAVASTSAAYAKILDEEPEIETDVEVVENESNQKIEENDRKLCVLASGVKAKRHRVASGFVINTGAEADSGVTNTEGFRGFRRERACVKRDTSMAAPKVDLEKFNRKNDFNMWKVKMEALLITQGLGEAIEPTTKKEGYEGSSSKSLELAAEIDKKAKNTIILSFSDSVIREVAKERTVAELWAKLENLYMTKSLANRLCIKKRMFSLKMAEGSSLEEHIDEFNKVCDTLETIDEGLNDKGKALLLINEVNAALNTRGLQEKQVNMESGEGHFKKDCPEKKQKKKEQNGDATIVEDEGYESAGACVATDEVQKDGEVVTGESSVSVKTNADNTKLWHLRKVWVYVLRTKDQVFGRFKEWKALVENQTEKKLKVLRTDNGLEYYNKMFDEFCSREGIVRHITVRLTPQQNGLAERMNRTLMEKVRCMMIQSELPKGLWVETLLTTCMLKPIENTEPQNKTDDIIQFEIEHPENKISSEAADSVEEVAGDGDTSSKHPGPHIEDYHPAKDREKKVIRPPKRFGYADRIAYALATSREIDEEKPRSYKEAMQSSYKID
ncbi:hypothetical protein KPL71_021398 [Citrus sinensis]|uniref:Uncharacterized protein n=1 Tax=Citrus sinensis TaxID=2711 RepID=A0ACB8JED4_CITSI|nr:hypothetical protein KPL71_021398 [Citrus sinensis]